MKTATQRHTVSPPKPLELGQVVISTAANNALSPKEVLRAINRHTYGDWGELDTEDRSANKRALMDSGQVFSAYRSVKGIKFYIITEWDRTYTTVLLPEDY